MGSWGVLDSRFDGARDAALYHPDAMVAAHCWQLLRRVEKHPSSAVRAYFYNLNYAVLTAYHRWV
jgi:hypothetical protein